jgi:hypothetical protein
MVPRSHAPMAPESAITASNESRKSRRMWSRPTKRTPRETRADFTSLMNATSTPSAASSEAR